jgi:hypothetical protein
MVLPRQILASLSISLVVLVILTIPSQIHSSPIESLDLSSDGGVAVDARHGEQGAHFEHSELVPQAPCPACLSSNKSDALFPPLDEQELRPPQLIRCAPPAPDFWNECLSLSAPGRAPPLP